jgi:hypothetical protein
MSQTSVGFLPTRIHLQELLLPNLEMGGICAPLKSAGGYPYRPQHRNTRGVLGDHQAHKNKNPQLLA